jgi:hypothetical protein
MLTRVARDKPPVGASLSRFLTSFSGQALAPSPVARDKAPVGRTPSGVAPSISGIASSPTGDALAPSRVARDKAPVGRTPSSVAGSTARPAPWMAPDAITTSRVARHKPSVARETPRPLPSTTRPLRWRSRPPRELFPPAAKPAPGDGGEDRLLQIGGKAIDASARAWQKHRPYRLARQDACETEGEKGRRSSGNCDECRAYSSVGRAADF